MDGGEGQPVGSPLGGNNDNGVGNGGNGGSPDPQRSPSPYGYNRGNTPDLVGDDKLAARSALEKIKNKVYADTIEIKESYIADRIDSDPNNLNTREVKVLASSLNSYFNSEYSYIKGTRPEGGADGNILTQQGKNAPAGALLTQSDQNPHNYTAIKYKDKAGIKKLTSALEAKLNESRSPSPNIIDDVG
jgi:hypothetical protein